MTSIFESPKEYVAINGLVKIYNYMIAALLLTGLSAYITAHSEWALHALYEVEGDMIVGLKPLSWGIMLVSLLLVFMLSFNMRTLSPGMAHAGFWLYSVLAGISLSSVFLAFTGASIAQAFFVTAGAFAGLSGYGYATGKSLDGTGSFLLMSLFGLVIASAVSLFLQSSGFQFGLAAAGVLIFAGLTVYDTRKIREYYADGGENTAIFGALTLYLDFINIFVDLIQLFGRQRRR